MYRRQVEGGGVPGGAQRINEDQDGRRLSARTKKYQPDPQSVAVNKKRVATSGGALEER